MKNKIEKTLEVIGITIVVVLTGTVLYFGFNFLYEAGKSIWKVLSK